jgi:plasmid stabilization system protein ParE
MVDWSLSARDDLRAIYDYISRDSRFYAKKVIRDIVERASSLDILSERGRVVPELNDTSVREIFVYSYRIMYQILSNRVEVLAVIHGQRNISAQDILPPDH